MVGLGKGYLGPGIPDDSSVNLLAKNIFDRYDKDKKDGLGMTEIGNILIEMYRSINKPFTPTKQDLDGFMKVLDVNKDGKVDMSDMISCINKYIKIDSETTNIGTRRQTSIRPSVYKQY